MDKRKICVVITARPSYSRIKTALDAINRHPQLELYLVVGASALLDRYGNVSETIERDGFHIYAKVFMVLEGENPSSMAKTTGIGILELSTVFLNLQPHAVLVVADRFETLAISIAAAYQNIPLVHIQGGEVTGNIDEKVRHANTKLADLHLTATEDARQRVIKMGENPEKVFHTGCPSIDLAKAINQNSTELSFSPYEKYGGVGSKPDYTKGYAVVMQHPVTNEYEASRSQIEETLKAILAYNRPTFWFWPNVDAGADGTSTGIRSYRERFQMDHVHFFKQMNPTDFLELLTHANVLIGNSSVGIRECAYLGVPVINIGSRQNRRQRGQNVKDVYYNASDILAQIQYWESAPRPKADLLYGDGTAGEKIAEVLATESFSYHKTISY